MAGHENRALGVASEDAVRNDDLAGRGVTFPHSRSRRQNPTAQTPSPAEPRFVVELHIVLTPEDLPQLFRAGLAGNRDAKLLTFSIAGWLTAVQRAAPLRRLRREVFRLVAPERVRGGANAQFTEGGRA
jgi:hypothetical protein